MKSSRCPAARAVAPKVMWMLFSGMCVSAWVAPSAAAKPRCGSDLLEDLMFVCGDRGIYFGKGSWSGYGARPRRQGIVERCCLSASGCELHHLEKYCAKPQPSTTTVPTTTTLPTTTTTVPTTVPTTTTVSTTTATTTTTARPNTLQHKTQQPSVFLKRLSQHLLLRPKKETRRKKTPMRRRSKSPRSRVKRSSEETRREFGERRL